MMTQKIVIALLIVCLAASIASVLKFAERNQFRSSTFVISLLMPFFLVFFMFDFGLYVYKKDLRCVKFPEKINSVFRFILLEIQIVPLIHTKLVEMFCDILKDKKVTIFQVKKNILVRAAAEDLRGKVFSIKFA